MHQETCVYVLEFRLADWSQAPSAGAGIIVENETNPVLAVFPVLKSSSLGDRCASQRAVG